MYRPGRKGAQKGVFSVDLLQIALHKFHALQGGPTQQRRIIRCDMDLMGGELRPVQPKESVDPAFDGGTPESVRGLKQSAQDPPLQKPHRPQLLTHPAKPFVVQFVQWPFLQRYRSLFRGGIALQRHAKDKLQGTQHFPGGLHRQGAAALPGIFGGHAAQQPRQLCLQTGKVILCQQPAGKGFLRQRSEIIPGAQPLGVDPLSICQSVGFHHFFLSLRIKEQSFHACSAKFPLTGLSATSILEERPSCTADPGNWTPARAYRLRASDFFQP